MKNWSTHVVKFTMEVEDTITINEEYASKYEKKKRAEELSKRKHIMCTYEPWIYITNNTRLHMRVFCMYIHMHKQSEISMETLD